VGSRCRSLFSKDLLAILLCSKILPDRFGSNVYMLRCCSPGLGNVVLAILRVPPPPLPLLLEVLPSAATFTRPFFGYAPGSLTPFPRTREKEKTKPIRGNTATALCRQPNASRSRIHPPFWPPLTMARKSSHRDSLVRKADEWMEREISVFECPLIIYLL